jgi:co-chaperonin GroES (HSP10)
MNTSGFEPLDLRVLVLPDDAEKKTAGGIILPDATGEREKYAMIFGTLVAVGENAWEEAASRSTNFAKPKVGEKSFTPNTAESRSRAATASNIG